MYYNHPAPMSPWMIGGWGPTHVGTYEYATVSALRDPRLASYAVSDTLGGYSMGIGMRHPRPYADVQGMMNESGYSLGEVYNGMVRCSSFRLAVS